jgi:hypothetical protein
MSGVHGPSIQIQRHQRIMWFSHQLYNLWYSKVSMTGDETLQWMILYTTLTVYWYTTLWILVVNHRLHLLILQSEIIHLLQLKFHRSNFPRRQEFCKLHSYLATALQVAFLSLPATARAAAIVASLTALWRLRFGGSGSEIALSTDTELLVL